MWILLETSTINSYKLHYYGPKKLDDKNDTVYYTVSPKFYKTDVADSSGLSKFEINASDNPLYCIMFIKEKYSTESYRLAGLWEFLNYNKEKIEHIPFFLITEFENGNSVTQKQLEKMTTNKNIHFLTLPKQEFDSLNATYFVEKPYYIDQSFFALVDASHHLRGYYDGRFAAEIKRLTQEYKHLRLKEEKQKLLKENEIKTVN